MAMTVNGCCTTAPGKEQYEAFTMNRKRYVQYDYRTPAGKLFSCVRPTLEQCRADRDKWLREIGE